MSRFPRGRTHDGRDGGFEMKLLVACCRSKRDSAADQSVLQLINAGIDWNLLLDLIDFHRVTLLVARNLSVVGLSGIPESVLERVRYSQKRTAIQNLEQSAELLRIVSLLQESGVDVIPFKGTVLARQLYGDLGLRESCDIDLIVHQQDVLAIKRILATAGYLPSTRLSPAQEAALIDSACVYELRNPNKDIDLELHWKNSKHPSLAFRPDFVPVILHQNLRITGNATEWGAQIVRHRIRKGFQFPVRRLQLRSSFRDVADLINTTENLDWTRLLRNADQLGARRMLLTGLSLAHGLLEAPVPDEILEAIRENPSAQRVSAESGRELFQGSRKEPGNWSICRFNLSSLDTWRGRIRYIAGMALRPGVRDLAAVSLPPFLFSFYRCIRLLRLMHHLTSHAQPSVGADGFKAQATHGF